MYLCIDLVCVFIYQMAFLPVAVRHNPMEGLHLDSFTFIKESIHKEPHETVRNAGRSSFGKDRLTSPAQVSSTKPSSHKKLKVAGKFSASPSSKEDNSVSSSTSPSTQAVVGTDLSAESSPGSKVVTPGSKVVTPIVRAVAKKHTGKRGRHVNVNKMIYQAQQAALPTTSSR